MAQTAQLKTFDVIENEAQRVFALQREAYLRHPYPSLEERRANLLAAGTHPRRQRRCARRRDQPGLRAALRGGVEDARDLRFRRRSATHAPQAREVDEAAAPPRLRAVCHRLESRHSPAQGRGGHRGAVELSALSRHQPAHQRARRRQPRHGQDGHELAAHLPAPGREGPRAVPRRHCSPFCRACAPRIFPPCRSTTSSSPARPTPDAR